MADSHSTPDTDQSGTERSLIVWDTARMFYDKSTPKSPPFRQVAPRGGV